MEGVICYIPWLKITPPRSHGFKKKLILLGARRIGKGGCHRFQLVKIIEKSGKWTQRFQGEDIPGALSTTRAQAGTTMPSAVVLSSLAR